MRLHEREVIVRKAETRLGDKFSQWLRHDADDLTDAEFVAVVTRVFADALGTHAKFAIRRERHGNEDKPGGLA